MLLAPAFALAYPGGISGYSGKAGMTCGSGCHSAPGGPAVTAAITGPATLAPGAKGTYLLTVSGGLGVVAGVDIAVSGSAATLGPDGTDTRLSSGEIVQSASKAFTGGTTGSASFSFTLTAPPAAGSLTLYGDGFSSDGTDRTAGGRDKATTFAVTVAAAGVDAGMTDAGVVDAGIPVDAGVASDGGGFGGVPSAGGGGQVGLDGGAPTALIAGGGCSVGGGAGGALALAALAFFGLLLPFRSKAKTAR